MPIACWIIIKSNSFIIEVTDLIFVDLSHPKNKKQTDLNGRYALMHFWEKWKKLKWSHSTWKSIVFGKFLQKLYCNSKMRQSISALPVISPFLKGWKDEYLRNLLSNHHNFFFESSYGINQQVLENEIQSNHQEILEKQHLGEILQWTSKLKFNINHISWLIHQILRIFFTLNTEYPNKKPFLGWRG